MDRPQAQVWGPGLEPGKRLLPAVIDHCAEKNPNRIYASIPYTDDPADGYRDITYRQFAAAIDKAAWWLQSVIGKGNGGIFDTFAYTGPKGLRYPVLALAAIKIGKRMLLASPSLGVAEHVHLLDVTGCRTYLYCPSAVAVVEELQKEWPKLRPIAIPRMPDWFNNKPTEHYEYNKTFEEAKDDAVMIFHTSGTTGLPKPFIYTNQMLTTFDAGLLLSDPKEKLLHNHFADSRVYSPLPLVHVIGMFLALQMTVFWNMTLVLGSPSDVQPTAETADQVIQFGNVSGVLYPTALLEDVVLSTAMFERIKNLKFAAYAGSSLSKPIGDVLSKSTRLIPIIGSTEVGLFTNYVLEPEHWNYFRFSREMGFDFERHSGNMYELIVHRKPGNERQQQLFHFHPSLDTYHTRDLFLKHPSEPEAWIFAGRTDDILMLTSGRLHAAEMEAQIQRNPQVRTAFVGGDGMKKPFLIVEMAPAEGHYGIMRRRRVIEQIWPTISLANENCAEAVRMNKSLIIIASPQKPLVKALNGSIMRQESMHLYRKELDHLYKEFWDRSKEFDQLSEKINWAGQVIKRTLSGERLRDNKDSKAKIEVAKSSVAA